MLTKNASAAAIYMGITGVYNFGLMLFGAFFMPYLIVEARLDPLGLLLMGTAFEAAIMLFEVPTGIVADVVSRRLSVIIGMLIVGVGMMLTAAFTDLVLLLATQALLGLGMTFLSGALEAWITDEVGEVNAGPLFLRAAQVGQAAAIGAFAAGIVLVTINIRVPLIIGGLLIVALGVALMAIMPETGFQRANETTLNPFGAMRDTFKAGWRHIRGHAVLTLLVLVGFFGGVGGEGYDRLTEAQFIRNIGLPALGGLDELAWFGVLGIVGRTIGIVAAGFARRRINTENQRQLAQTLIAVQSLVVIGSVGFALAADFAVGLLPFLVFYVGNGAVMKPLMAAWVNLNVPSQVRATVLSMSNQMHSLGELLAGPIIGVIGQRWGIRAALLVSSVLLSPTLLLFVRTLRHHRRADA